MMSGWIGDFTRWDQCIGELMGWMFDGDGMGLYMYEFVQLRGLFTQYSTTYYSEIKWVILMQCFTGSLVMLIPYIL